MVFITKMEARVHPSIPPYLFPLRPSLITLFHVFSPSVHPPYCLPNTPPLFSPYTLSSAYLTFSFLLPYNLSTAYLTLSFLFPRDSTHLLRMYSPKLFFPMSSLSSFSFPFFFKLLALQSHSVYHPLIPSIHPSFIPSLTL